MSTYKRISQGNGQRSETGKAVRRKRKKFIPTLLLRFTVTTALLAGTCFVCYTALSNISRPYVLGAEQASQIAQQTKSLEKIELENAQLTQQSAYLVRPDGIEYEARLKGYLLPGEQSLVITPPTDSSSQ